MLYKQLLSQRKKSNAFYDVTMSYGFENQISAFCDNYSDGHLRIVDYSRIIVNS